MLATCRNEEAGDMEVYVVMGNDFPDSVFADKITAERYCEEKRIDHEPRIYWRVYEFEVRQ